MSETQRIADQLRRAFEGEAWHGPSVMEVLRDVDANRAARRPLASAHNIWEVVLHIAAWQEFVLRRVQGERIVDVTAGQDWPPVGETSDAAWQNALKRLRDSHTGLHSAIGAFPEKRLWEQVSGKDYDFYAMLHGVVQHNLYHAGQVALLKKAA